MELDGAALRLDVAGADVTAVATRLGAGTPPPTAFGASAAGALGDLGRAMHGQATTALEARVAEARALATRLTALAESVRGAATAYRSIESAPGTSARLSGGI